jgi:hypothetical protein
MFTHSIEKAKESRLVSPIAVAVNVGDVDLLDVLVSSKLLK